VNVEVTKVRTILILVLAAMAVMVFGCQKAAEKAAEKMIEAQSGGKVSADISGGKVTVTDKETGAESVVGTGAKMPEGWPASMPQYPGSTVMQSVTQDAPEGKMLHVMMTTQDSPKAVLDFYKEKAKAAGYKVMTESSLPEGGMIVFEGASESVHVNAMTAENGCNIVMDVMPPRGK
jgi:DNA-binding NarL/FixJ family response regulator